ncbi:PREDICTED: GRIP1-associated protein 1-like, partial [Gekko japonicus]|uniref:GRIP1-associated protein 1-like n=1 Tax=Gekko japonicus TaxID=146911 RepID=A0ABM1KUD8_GEKJA
EVDALLSENEMLQGKLHSQEDDFRLQNSTLMQELSKLCSQIEQLETENKRLREGEAAATDGGGAPTSPVDGELLRLQAENSALQKNMAALQERYEKEVAQQADSRGPARGDTSAEAPPAGQEGPEPRASESGASQAQQLLSEVELKWQTEQEEKRLLKEQLQSLE